MLTIFELIILISIVITVILTLAAVGFTLLAHEVWEYLNDIKEMKLTDYKEEVE